MKEESKRVQAMKKNYIRLHEQGKTIKEIAEEYHITQASIYNNLQKIADMNGIKDRDSLLNQPHKPYGLRLASTRATYIFDTNEVTSICIEAKNKASKLLNQIDETLKGE